VKTTATQLRKEAEAKINEADRLEVIAQIPKLVSQLKELRKEYDAAFNASLYGDPFGRPETKTTEVSNQILSIENRILRALVGADKLKEVGL
jgi:hypothetical protein